MKILLTLALLGAVAWLWRRFLTPRSQMVHCDSAPVRRSARSTPTPIICADCNRFRQQRCEQAGLPEPMAPHKSFLTSDGRCDGCGSRAYELASVAGLLWAARIKRQFAAEHGLSQVYSDAPREEWKEERL